ncbi:hypothetical protein M0802_009527 [Mischocyttarus mexicanus]|nr:hypothetical protein M0802_009527 [Mischocyttarus mexicanus]
MLSLHSISTPCDEQESRKRSFSQESLTLTRDGLEKYICTYISRWVTGNPVEISTILNSIGFSRNYEDFRLVSNVATWGWSLEL